MSLDRAGSSSLVRNSEYVFQRKRIQHATMVALLCALAGVGANAIEPSRQIRSHHPEVGLGRFSGRCRLSAECGRIAINAKEQVPRKSLCLRANMRAHCKGGAQAAAATELSAASERVLAEKERGPCIVWFKHDLRTDDHPGLLAASAYNAAIPIYVFDPVLVAGWSPLVLKAVHDAVVHLQKDLELLGSDLVVQVGSTTDVIAELVQETGAVDIFAEEEVEQTWKEVVAGVSSGLPSGNLIASLKHWSGSLYEGCHAQDWTTVSFKEFERLRVSPSHPLDPPISLPPLPKSVVKGTIPSVEDIFGNTRMAMSRNPLSAHLKNAQDILPAEEVSVSAPAPSGGPFQSLLEWRKKYILSSPYAALEQLKALNNAPKGPQNFKIDGGATGAATALDGYLRFLEPTDRDDWQKMFEHVWTLESRPGASFRSLFGPSLSVGALSLRRIYHKAIEYEKARLGGRLSPFGFSSFTVAAALSNTKAIEWYQKLAKNSQVEGQGRGLDIRTWRWRTFLVQYSVAGLEGPAVLLVHGFGAFWEHYRDNLEALASKGNRVWALTLLGFGRSEKPNVMYTELFWSELVRDFIVEVVKHPVVLAGNSIGGFIASIVAGLWPMLVTSLVLINSAGIIVPNYEAVRYKKPKVHSALAWGGARLLMVYLRSSSDRLLRMCYPVNNSRADDWLAQEVTRASHDPGAVAVLESIFFLRRPMPLNYFLDRYGGKVLSIQGAKDPLNNAPLRASLLKTHCKNVEVHILDAGHCPHDEVPDQVNTILEEWIRTAIRNSPSEEDTAYAQEARDAKSRDLSTKVVERVGAVKELLQ